MSLLTPEAFSQKLGVSPQAARLAFRNAAEGRVWRGFTLPVVQVPGQKGGVGGTVWGLRLDACSPTLLAKLGMSSDPVEAPVKPAFNASVQGRQFDEQAERLRIIQPILATVKGSTDRAAAFRAAASRMHVLKGRPATVAEKTLRGWVLLYETKGAAALLHEQRADKGKARVTVSWDWDSGIDLPDDARARVVEALNSKARSMIALDGTSGREVIRICSGWLVCACVDEGSKLSRAQLGRICTLNTKWEQQFECFRAVYMHRKDHKAHQDKAVVRIGRELHPTPMGLLIGDVHYVDLTVGDALTSSELSLIAQGVAARTFGKETIRVRLIAWMDASSHFVWITPVFLSKGQGILQEDVAASLFQVTTCPHGGIPSEYYLDNGSEYGALSDAMARMSVLADKAFGVTLAKPYSPTSKGMIEGFFNILEGIFKGLPGWIGGDRTNKKSQNKGKVVAPYRRGLAQLEQDIAAAVAIYNDRPQAPGGLLGGLSPLAMLERKIAETGFVARVPSEDAFDLIFSKEDTRTLQQGCLNYAGDQYHAPFLDKFLPGAKFDILIPLRKNGNAIFVRHGGKDLGWAEALPTFAHGDRDGARLQSRLERGKGDAIRALAALVDPTVSTFEMQKAAVGRIAPNAPLPETWTTRAIDKTAAPKEEPKSFLTAEMLENFERHIGLDLPSPKQAVGK